jgi:hypothetical protein
MNIELELTTREENQLLQNSIERVINTSMDIANKFYSEHPDAPVNHEDWEELKVLTNKLWNSARNEVFKKRNNMT